MHTPDSDRFTPLTVLKESPHGTSVLVREVMTSELLVARRVPFPPRSGLAEASLDTVLNLNHPSLQPVLGLEYSDDATWVMSSFIAGYPADCRPQVRSLAMSWSILWITQLLELLDFLHQQSFTLGHIAPSDLVLGESGAVLVDLGCYERLMPKSARADALMEPPPFMAPEQVDAWEGLPQSDIWSAAAVAWYLLTDRVPDLGPEPNDPDAVALALQSVARLPNELTAIFGAMLAAPERRPSAAQALEWLQPWTWQPRPRPAVPPPYVLSGSDPAPWLAPPAPIEPEPEVQEPRTPTMRVLPNVAPLGPGAPKAPATRQIGEAKEAAPQAPAVLTILSATEDPLVAGYLSPDWEGYRPVALLKSSPMSQVVLVEEIGSKRLLVARRLTAPSTVEPEEAWRACEMQWRILQQVDHHGLQKVVLPLPTDDAPWLLCEFVPGYPADQLKELFGTPPASLVAWWMVHLLEGVEALHRCGLAVGRMEVSDVVIGAGQAALVDLRFLERTFATMEGTNERRHAMQADPASDVRSIAACGYWLLTGKSGFCRDNAEYTAIQVALTQLKNAISGELRKSLLRMLHFEPAKRPRSAREAIQLLDHSWQDLPATDFLATSPHHPTPWLKAMAPVIHTMVGAI